GDARSGATSGRSIPGIVARLHLPGSEGQRQAWTLVRADKVRGDAKGERSRHHEEGVCRRTRTPARGQEGQDGTARSQVVATLAARRSRGFRLISDRLQSPFNPGVFTLPLYPLECEGGV